jgi:HEAT repeat protein
MRLGVLMMATLVAPVRAQDGAQQTPPVAPQEALMLAQGWGYLSNGDAAHAAQVAGLLLTQFPLSEAGVALAVEAEMPRSGWIGALTVYEQWLGARRLDSGYALRRVARGCLRDALHNVETRATALEALIADGDQDATTQAVAASASGKFVDTQALAIAGNEQAIKALIAQLESQPGGKGAIIAALARTHSRLAIAPLVKLLDDPNDVTQASAIDGLGQLGAVETINKIRPFLDDKKPPYVRFAAARALGRLGDASGTAFLRTELDKPTNASATRIAAAAGLAAIGPDTGWVDTARALLSDPDPTVRAEAARILAPYDNATAKAHLTALLEDPNPAVRQLAAMTMAKDVANDFATLRSLLRSSDGEARTRAAARILELTR